MAAGHIARYIRHAPAIKPRSSLCEMEFQTFRCYYVVLDYVELKKMGQLCLVSNYHLNIISCLHELSRKLTVPKEILFKKNNTKIVLFVYDLFLYMYIYFVNKQEFIFFDYYDSILT